MATPQTISHIDLKPRGSIKTLKFLSHHLRHATNLFPNRNQNHFKSILGFSLRTLRKGARFATVRDWNDRNEKVYLGFELFATIHISKENLIGVWTIHQFFFFRSNFNLGRPFWVFNLASVLFFYFQWKS